MFRQGHSLYSADACERNSQIVPIHLGEADPQQSHQNRRLSHVVDDIERDGKDGEVVPP